jgi:tight adherence protein C
MVPVFFLAWAGADMLLSSRRRSLGFRNRAFPNSGAQPLREFIHQVGRFGPNQALLKIPWFHRRLDDLLLRSGFPYGWGMEDLLFYKEASVIVAVLLLTQLGARQPLLWGILLVGSFWSLDILLHMRASTRRTEMQRELPGLVDLMVLTVESGLDLIVAVERIFEKMKPGPLRDELQVLLQESRLGAPRREILERWAWRTGLSDAQSLASLIIQSEEMGTPLSNVLRNYAEDMRSRRILRAEELAGKIPVKILFPMMVFFFPIVFVIILGPVALEFMRNK